MDQAPGPLPSPLFRNVYHGPIQHFQQVVTRGKDGLGLGHLVQLAVKTIDGIGSVDQSANLLGVLEIGAEISSVGPPGLRDFRVFLVPALPKGVQSIQGGLLVHSGIDCIQIVHKGLQVLVGHTYLLELRKLVDDTVLKRSLWEDGMNHRAKTCQIIGAGNENILCPPVFQAIEDSCPKLGTLVFANPHLQDVFPAIQVNSNGNVHCFLHNLHFAADMIVDGIQKCHSIGGFQGPLLLLFDDGQNLVRDLADRAV